MGQAQWTPTVLNSQGYYYVHGNGISSSGAVGYGMVDDQTVHALYWSSGTSNYVDLNPTGSISSNALASFGGNQYGQALFRVGTQDQGHAVIWHGSADNFDDLHPGGEWAHTDIRGASANCQIGTGYGLGPSDGQVLLWHGSAASMVDLTPDGAVRASGWGTTDISQVGSVDFGNGPHATLWHGTKESAVDLNPSWCEFSNPTGVYGDQQVGVINFFDQDENYFIHAALWSGTAESIIDLNPNGIQQSVALGISANFQVGYGDGHAMVWFGSAENYFDLHSTLAGLPSTFDSSFATGVDENGDIIGYGTDETGYHAIRWTHVVPEPGTWIALGIGLTAFCRRKKLFRN
jgi:hypothetical protein